MSSPARKPEVTPKQLTTFALILPVFCALLGFVAIYKPQGLLIAIIFCAVATLIAALAQPKGRWTSLRAFAIPVILLAIYLPLRFGASPKSVAIAIFAIGVAIGAMILLSPTTGRGIYDGWIYLAEPIGFGFSLVILALAFYLVFFPIGLIMRLVGYDPMKRALDRNATTYWEPHDPAADPDRYFRQF